MSDKKVYPEGLLGRKVGMTQIFTEEGKCIPVTAVEVGPCYVLEVKETGKHGYSAVQIGFVEKKQQRVSKPALGHFSKAGKGAFYHVREVRCDIDTLGWNEQGKELSVGQVFAQGDVVDVTGVSKGRGFAGVVKRYDVRGQPASRGTHEKFRNIGSIGNCKSPGRVWKNQKMPGHMGNKNVTTQNMKVVGVRPEDNVLLIKGSVPGAKGGVVFVKKARNSYTGATAPAPEQQEEQAA